MIRTTHVIKLASELDAMATFNQTQQSSCGSTGQAYYEGFISGCISSGGGDYSACDAKTG